MSQDRKVFLHCIDWADCQLCPYGASAYVDKEPYRVFYKGNPDANVFLLGEGPGSDEIKSGKPFIGRAGKLLDSILEFAKVPRWDCCVANTMVCSDDGKKKPTIESLSKCDFWRELLYIVKPKLLICLGGYAARAAMSLGPDIQLYKLLGMQFTVQNLPTFVEYHPAYLLRNPKAKQDAAKRWNEIGSVYHKVTSK
jgi:DNA polymerase